MASKSDAVKDPNEPHLVPKIVHIKDLQEGSYFGEVALITNLKRTVTVTSTNFCTLSTMSREMLQQARDEYPTIYLNFRNKIRLYEDMDFTFRRNMIRNIPYL
jgi:CRP-like cAMP-binding protein